MATLQQRYLAALERRGFKTVLTRSSKFISVENAEGKRCILGKAGSVRLVKKGGYSVPISDQTKARLLSDEPAP